MHEIAGSSEIPTKEKDGLHKVELACTCGNLSLGYSVKDVPTAKKFAFEYWWRHKEGREMREAA